MKTGDITWRDSEGYYYIIDRKKELIKYKVSQHYISTPMIEYSSRTRIFAGIPRLAAIVVDVRVTTRRRLLMVSRLAVAPAELESILLDHPDIVDVGVIGIDDPAQATELPR